MCVCYDLTLIGFHQYLVLVKVYYMHTLMFIQECPPPPKLLSSVYVKKQSANRMSIDLHTFCTMYNVLPQCTYTPGIKFIYLQNAYIDKSNANKYIPLIWLHYVEFFRYNCMSVWFWLEKSTCLEGIFRVTPLFSF